MANVGQVYHNVIDKNSGNPITGSIDIFTDIVAQQGAEYFSKIGIQAPPGTRVVLNNTKTIMIGRTGIYELDENIMIEHMYFVRPRLYVKDEAASEEAKQDGIQGMLLADETRQTELDELNANYPDGIPTTEEDEGYEEYWDQYNAIQSKYIEAYKKALSLFNTGSNGIYVLPDPQNPDSEANFKDLYNVIVDFIYSI